MALPGELKGVNGTVCCGEILELDVERSNAGYYLGYWCSRCGPYSRESGYFGSYEEALGELNKIKAGESTDCLRNTNYTPGTFTVEEV